jgi:hypothetical protein
MPGQYYCAMPSYLFDLTGFVAIFKFHYYQILIVDQYSMW